MNSSTLRAMQELVQAMLMLPEPSPDVDMCVFRMTSVQENGRKFIVVDYPPFKTLLDAYNDLLAEEKQATIATLFDEMKPLRFEFSPVQ